MKRFYLFAGIIIILLIFVIMFAFKGKDKGVHEFEQIYHLKLPKDTMSEKLFDNYSGFPHEGMLLYRYVFTTQGARQFISHITIHDRWNVLPLSDAIDILMYGGRIGDTNYNYRFAEKVGLPEVTNGYWKVISDKPIQTTNLKYIMSFDFSLAIYDTETDILYMFRVNT